MVHRRVVGSVQSGSQPPKTKMTQTHTQMKMKLNRIIETQNQNMNELDANPRRYWAVVPEYEPVTSVPSGAVGSKHSGEKAILIAPESIANV